MILIYSVLDYSLMKTCNFENDIKRIFAFPILKSATECSYGLLIDNNNLIIESPNLKLEI
jgi:hypothetical protein